MSKLAKLRYEIGMEYVFARPVYLDRDTGKVRKSGLYDPTRHDLKDIEFVLARCEEHHRVHWDQDPSEEKKYDGFVFSRVDGPNAGARFCNQYPSASYGQTTTDQDWKIEPEFDSAREAELDAMHEADRDAWFAESYGQFTEFAYFIRPVVEAVDARSNRSIRDHWSPEAVEALVAFRDRAIAAAEELGDFKVEIGPWARTTPEGEIVVMENIINASIVRNAAPAPGI